MYSYRFAGTVLGVYPKTLDANLRTAEYPFVRAAGTPRGDRVTTDIDE